MAEVVLLGAGKLQIPTGEKQDGRTVVNVYELSRIAVTSGGVVVFEDEAGVHAMRLNQDWDVMITDVEYSVTQPGALGVSEPAYECEHCKDGELLPQMPVHACPKCRRGVGGRQHG